MVESQQQQSLQAIVNSFIKGQNIDSQLKKVIEFRHWMHQNAEGHLNEVNTQAKIKEALKELAGIQETEIKHCAGTGLIVDI